MIMNIFRRMKNKGLHEKIEIAHVLEGLRFEVACMRKRIGKLEEKINNEEATHEQQRKPDHGAISYK